MFLSGGFYFPDGEEHFVVYGENVAQYQEPQRIKAFEYVTKWRCAVDIGAHVGIFSRDFAQRFKRVVALEPTPTNRQCLKRNVPENVAVMPFACGDRRRDILIKRHTVNSGGSEVLVRRPRTPGLPNLFKAKMIPLDDLGLRQVDLIKVDVQGTEVATIRGMMQTLRREGPVLLMEEKPLYGPGGTTHHIEEAREIILSCGYTAGEKVGADRIYIPA